MPFQLVFSCPYFDDTFYYSFFLVLFCNLALKIAIILPMLSNILCDFSSINNQKVEPMLADIDDNFPDETNNAESDETAAPNNFRGNALAKQKVQEQAKKNILARKRIDELKEKKRLKDLLDDSEDW